MFAMIRRLWKPWYLWRPGQLLLRAARAWTPPSPGYQPLHTAWGVTLLADPSRAIGRCIWTTGVYDLAVTELLARLIRPGDTVIDAGANVGYMTLLAAACAGRGGKVVAFEPHPELFALLQRNVASLARTRPVAEVLLRNVALGERAGRAELVLPETFQTNDGVAHLARGTASPSSSIPVEVVPLDAELGPASASVLKVDVEGFELAVLQGAARALETRRIRHIVFEEHRERESAVVPFLQGLGYQVYSVGWSIMRPRVDPLAGEKGTAAPGVGGSSSANAYEAPSYLATLDAEGVERQCRRRGWLTLAGWPFRRGIAGG